MLRYTPLPGNAILTERTIPAELVLGTGVGVSLLLGTALWLLAKVGALAQQVGRLARTDALTGTANRRAWDGREEAIGLVARADRALYAAKEAGRNRCLADQPTADAPAAPTPRR